MIMLRTTYRSISQLLSHVLNPVKSCQLVQSSILNQFQTVAEPARSIFTLSNNSIMSLQPVSSFLQKSPVLHESKRNQGTSKIYHPYAPMTRNLLKFGPKQGKPRTERVVLHKFYRLHWGMWIRAIAGRDKKIWKKTLSNRKRSKRVVFCNAQQCTLLDKMTHENWKKPKYYVDDPYEPYHTREEFPFTRKKPVEWP